MITLDGIVKKYKIKDGALKWHDFNALYNVNINIIDNTVTGICGISGSGKTTIANIISGYSDYDNGSILYEWKGKKYSKMPHDKYLRNVFQDPYTSLNNLTDVKWHIEKAAGMNGVPVKTAEEKLLSVLPVEYMDRGIDTLSGGERQKLAFAIALISDPDVLVLDESFSMLDTLNLFYMLQLIRDLKNNMAVVYLDNDINRVLFSSDYIYIIDHGNIVEQGSAGYLAEHQKSNILKNMIKYHPSIYKRI